MFEGFANVWTPAELSRNVKQKPVKVMLAGEALVVFRNKEGKAGALLDRCPHRGVSLALGNRTPDGCIECPFHGWRFDTTGACTHVPFNEVPDHKRERLSARALPTEEIGGVIWIYTGFGEPTAFEPPPLLKDPTRLNTPSSHLWNVHWTRAMENMLDFPHLPYAHAGTIGRGMKKQVTDESRMKVMMEDRPHGMFVTAETDGKKMEAELDWRKPNCSVLHLILPQGDIFTHIFPVPIDATRTRMILIQSDTSRFSAMVARISTLFNNKILFEDQRVVETSYPIEAPDPVLERSVATDAPTLAFRRWYYKQLRNSRAEVPGSRGGGQAETAIGPEGRGAGREELPGERSAGESTAFPA